MWKVAQLRLPFTYQLRPRSGQGHPDETWRERRLARKHGLSQAQASTIATLLGLPESED
jgi:hypothetical protein